MHAKPSSTMLQPFLRDGETELVSDALENEPAPTKLAYAGAAASIILLGAGAVCWLCGNDLLGGASLSPHSLKAAEVRALCACLHRNMPRASGMAKPISKVCVWRPSPHGKCVPRVLCSHSMATLTDSWPI